MGHIELMCSYYHFFSDRESNSMIFVVANLVFGVKLLSLVYLGKNI